jgi:hypothetical protein
MANQISVNTGSGAGAQQVIVDSNGNITVTVSRSVIGTVANVASANYANFAGEVVDASQPNITSVGNLTSLTVTGTTTTGNLVVQGNLQVGNLVANSANYANFAGNAFAVAGANVSGAVANATFATTAGSANTANSATVANSANAVAGANVSGTVANATYAANAGNANFANTATVANSANSVTLANVSGAGNIASINLDGNVANVLKGNGTFGPEGSTGNANYANFAGTAFSVSGSNVSGTVANATYAANAGNANFANSATVAASANSVTLANVSGAGNIASINLDGSGSNVLYGNGAFAPVSIGPVANANYANFAGNAYAVDGANVSGTVANATFALDAGNANIANIAYSVDGANVSGTVANATFALDAGNANIANTAYSVDAANVSGLGNIATINLDGNASNFLDGTGNFVAAPGGANANYANFAGTVLTNAQPNITSVGNLSALTVTGNIQGNAILYSNTIIYNGNTASTDKILVQADLPGAATVRSLGLRGANVSNALASNSVAGGILLNGGGATNTDAGNVWLARGGGVTCIAGIANTANGNAFGGGGGFQAGAAITQVGVAAGGGFNLINGSAISNNGSATSGGLIIGFGSANSINGNATAGNTQLGGMSTNANTGNATGGTVFIVGANNRTITSGNATGGTINLISGNARSENGSATSGNISLSTGPANANVSGTATVGSINIEVGAANGVTGNIRGNINIGTGTNANAVNIGSSSVPVQVNGNLNVNTIASTGTLNFSTNGITNGVGITGRSIALNGANTGAGNISSVNLINGALNWTLDNTIFSGGTPFGMVRYNTGFLEPLNYFTARGNAATPADVQAGDTAYAERVQVRYNGGTSTIFNSDVSARSFSPSNTVATTYSINALDDQANSLFQVNFGTSKFAGDIIPETTDVYSLGNSTNRWSNLWLTGNTIYFGNANIKSDGSNVTITNPDGGELIISGNSVVSSNSIVYGNSIIDIPVANGNVDISVDGNTMLTVEPNQVSIGNGAVTLGVGGGAGIIESFEAYLGDGGLVSTGGLRAISNDGTLPYLLSLESYGNSYTVNPINNYRKRGTPDVPAGIETGDQVMRQQFLGYVGNATSGTDTPMGTFSVECIGSDNPNLGPLYTSIYLGTESDTDTYSNIVLNSSTVNIAAPRVEFVGGFIQDSTLQIGSSPTAITLGSSGNITLANGNTVLTNDGKIIYARSFGSFTSNVTQTNSNVGNTIYMTLNNDEGSTPGMSVVFDSQITTEIGRYNIQFSAQVEKTDAGVDEVEIWLEKNGSPVANSATRLTQQGNNVKGVAAWNWLVDSANVNDYYQIAWASNDANMQITAIDSGNTLSGVAIPSVIVTVVPVGA